MVFNKRFFTIVVLIITIVEGFGQANWEFVGPKSNNNASGAEFETSQMTKVLTGPSNWVFATSKFGGFWKSNDKGSNWTNVNMAPTGLDQAIAIANKNSNEVLIGNFHQRSQYEDIEYSYSTRVSSYNFTTDTWSHYTPLPTAYGRLIINCVAVHPNNQNIIYAGTSIGLFRFDGASWTLIVANSYIESIVFVPTQSANWQCYISGENQPLGSSTPAQSLILFSEDSGNSFFQSFTSSYFSDISVYPRSRSEICSGPGGVFVLTVCEGTTLYNSQTVNAEHRYVHRIIKNGSSYPSTIIRQWIDNAHTLGSCEWSSNASYAPVSSSKHRMAIAYNSAYNLIVTGGTKGTVLYLTSTYQIYTNSCLNYSDRMLNGNIHYDTHDFHSSGSELWVACDGGIALSTITQPPPNPIPNLGSWNRKNNNLNVSLLYGFSGSEKDENIYAFGGHDINNNDIYDASIGIEKDIYTHQSGENDGALIYKHDENIVILDHFINDMQTKVSIDGGQSIISQNGAYKPYQTTPFTANYSDADNGPINGGFQRTIQDPFRPGRIYQIGRNTNPTIYQFDFDQNVMAQKVDFAASNFSSGTKVSHYQAVQDISFSGASKNLLYVLTSAHWPANVSSAIIRYIGPDLDDCWHGHNEYTSGSWPQWGEIILDYANLGTILGGGVANVPSNKMGRVWLKKIETSVTNKDLIYVAGTFDFEAPNDAIKVLRFDGFTWTNYSNGIPAEALVNTMVMDHYSNDALYLGTDMGVYYRDASMSYWEPYFTGMPFMTITQMEINYKENTVRASTFGQGIWKSPLKCPTTEDLHLTGGVQPNYYEAKRITSNGTHGTSQTPCMLRATEYIILQPGFIVSPGINNTYLQAIIHGCDPSSGSSPYIFRGGAEPDEELKLAEESLKTFNLFPNPNNGSFILQFNQYGEKIIEIKDLMGRKIREFETESSEVQLNLSELKKGIYFVKVKIGKTEMVKKVIID